MLQTVVIIDGLNLVGDAVNLAAKARPDHQLIFTVYGIESCQELTDDKGAELHVHWFSDDISMMQKGMENRKAQGIFGGYLYVTQNPRGEHVRVHCNGLAALSSDARPEILQVG